MPAALVIASRIAGSEEAGTDLSSSTETCWLSTVPGAIVEWVTVLETPSEEVVVSCLKLDLPPAPVAAVVRFAVPVTPPAPLPLPVSVSVVLLCCVGVPVLPYSSDSLVVWSTFMLA